MTSNQAVEIDEVFKSAVEAQQAGRLKQAIEGYRQVLSVDPSRFTALNNLGMALHAVGQIEEALSCYQRVLEAKDNPLTRNNLGNALRDLGRREEAVEQYRRTLELNAESAEAHSNLGVTLAELGRVGEAVPHLERAVALKPEAANMHCNLGNARQAQAQIDEAVSLYRKALELNSDYAEAHSNLATALVALGRHDEALLHFQRAVTLRPDLGAAQRQLAQLDPDAVDSAQITRLLNNARLPKNHRWELCFALAEVSRAKGNHDRAFSYYAEANRLKRTTTRFDPSAHALQIDDLIRVFSQEFFESRTQFSLDSELPVLVIGFPRSGTSLVEQILASHPAICGGGELPYLPGITRRLAAAASPNGYPDCMRRLDAKAARSLADLYLQKLKKSARRGETPERITDKLPQNYLCLGLVRLLLPRARIIHCRRDARDACLSVYFQSFTGSHPYAWDLKDIGSYYGQYHRLMKHWRSVVPSEQMLEVRYEDLVAEQEAVSRKLIDFVGLEWDPRCLEFYRVDRPVTSASHAGVRRPVYTDAVGRWRDYRKHLAPLIEALESIVKE